MPDYPTHWANNRLGDLLEVQNGYAFDSDLFSDTDGTPLIRIRDLKVGTRTEAFFSGPYDPGYLVNAGDYLVGMDGNFGCYRWNGPQALLNQRVCRLHKFSRHVDPDFIFFGINEHLAEIEANTSYATVKHLSSKQIKSIGMAFPPLDEQRRIVARIKACMERIDEIKNLSSGATGEAEALRMAVLRDAVASLKDRATERELGSLVRVASGDFLPSSKMKSEGGYPVYGGNGITGHHDQYLFEAPVIVVGRVGAKCGCVHITQPNSWVTDNALYVRTQIEQFDQRFLAYMLEVADLRQYARQAAQPVISGKAIYPVAIPYLDFDQQVVIADEIEAALSSVIALTNVQADRLKETSALRSAVLRKAFAGEL